MLGVTVKAGVTHSVIYHVQGDESENSLEFFNPDQIIDTTPVFVLHPGSSWATQTVQRTMDSFVSPPLGWTSTVPSVRNKIFGAEQ